MMMNESMDDVDMIPNGGAVTTDNTLTMARNQRVYGPNHVRHARMSAIEVPSPNLQTSLGMVMIKSTQKQQQSINNKSQTTTPTASLVTPTIGVTAFAEGRRAGVGVNGERNKKRSKWQSDEEDEMDSEEDDTYDSSDVESSKVRKRNKVYPPWSVDEDKIILDLQKDLGNNWVEIARQLKGRSRLDVKSRHRSLVRAFNRMWKPEEDKIVLQCHAEFKGDWVEQASKLINRSRNAIRVRFKELTENKILSKAKHIAKQGSPNQLFSQNKSQSSISPMLPTVKEQRINNEGDVISKNNMKTDLIGNRNSSYPQPQSQSTVATTTTTTTTSVAPIIGNDPLMTSTNMVSHITIPSYHNTQSQPQQSNPYQMNGHGNNNIKTQQTFNQMSDLSARYSHNNNNNIKSNTYMLFGAPDNTVMNNNTQYDNGNAIMNKINTNVMTNTAPLSTNTNNNNDSYLLSSPLSDCMLTPLHIPLYFDEDELDTLLQCLV